MEAIIAAFFRPITLVFASIIVFISFLLGALINPGGAANFVICKIIDVIDVALPSTPPALQISSLLQTASTGVPLVGYGVFQLIASTIFQFFLITVVIKVYKLIPFKMS